MFLELVTFSHKSTSAAAAAVAAVLLQSVQIIGRGGLMVSFESVRFAPNIRLNAFRQ